MPTVKLIELEDAIVTLLRAEFASGLLGGNPAADHIGPHTGDEEEDDNYRYPWITVATADGKFTEAGSSGAQFDLDETVRINCRDKTRRNRIDDEGEGDQSGAFELIDEVYRIMAGTLVSLPAANIKVEAEPVVFTVGEDSDEGFIGVIVFRFIVQMEGN